MTIKNFGSFNDPMNYLGLTHLLEHLIILIIINLLIN